MVAVKVVRTIGTFAFFTLLIALASCRLPKDASTYNDKGLVVRRVDFVELDAGHTEVMADLTASKGFRVDGLQIKLLWADAALEVQHETEWSPLGDQSLNDELALGFSMIFAPSLRDKIPLQGYFAVAVAGSTQDGKLALGYGHIRYALLPF
jgi:hypothetical protein